MISKGFLDRFSKPRSGPVVANIHDIQRGDLDCITEETDWEDIFEFLEIDHLNRPSIVNYFKRNQGEAWPSEVKLLDVWFYHHSTYQYQPDCDIFGILLKTKNKNNNKIRYYPSFALFRFSRMFKEFFTDEGKKELLTRGEVDFKDLPENRKTYDIR